VSWVKGGTETVHFIVQLKKWARP